ncbi:hypothetical protein, partial [Micromonospora sp. 15K316]|uniref:hypothetical protein n=1 Tax=Micromonospora sp. 15K316 TaxID=2530376 RepID=UPI001A9CF916
PWPLAPGPWRRRVRRGKDHESGRAEPRRYMVVFDCVVTDAGSVAHRSAVPFRRADQNPLRSAGRSLTIVERVATLVADVPEVP